jgi:hypothetical protein
MVSCMNDLKVQLLGSAQHLMVATPKVSSLALPTEHGSGGVAVPWRLNGHIPVHPLHGLASRVGGFPPQLPRYFIRRFSRPGDIVCDPFCGKGTTLLEAVSSGRRALGCDICPDAVVLSRAKTDWPQLDEVLAYINRLPRQGVNQEVPADTRLFFHRETLRQILAIRQRLLADLTTDRRSHRQLALFCTGVLLGILHGRSQLSLSLPCNHAFAMSPAYVRRYMREHHLKRPARDVIRCMAARTLALLPGPDVKAEADVYEDDSQQMTFNVKGNWSGHVDLIITSPPYLARQTYIKDSWLRLWLLNRDPRSIRAKSLETGDIVKFVEMMRRCLHECIHLLKPGGRCFLVCGTSHCSIANKETKVPIGGLVMLAAEEAREGRYRWQIENYIDDRIVLKRGSYFAIRSTGDIENSRRRVGEDHIVSLMKVKK